MKNEYDIIEVAVKYGYNVRMKLCEEADLILSPKRGEREEDTFSYPVRGISFIADEVIQKIRERA